MNFLERIFGRPVNRTYNPECDPDYKEVADGQLMWTKKKENIMNTVIRAKVKVDRIIEHIPENGEKASEQLVISAVYSADKTTENYSFSQATPHLQMNMTINNPGAFGVLKEGMEYYLDFIPVAD